MRRLATLALLVALVVAIVSSVAAAATIKQVVLPDKSSIIVTGVNTNPTEAIDGFRHEMIIFTPAFKGPISVLGGAAAVVAVVNDKVVSIDSGTLDDSLPKAPAIPANGYVLYGAGRGYAALTTLAVGDVVKIVEKTSAKPAKLPTKVVGDGDSMDITAFDIGRGAGELIVYTPDFGSKTWTNEWGFEAVVVKGVVQTVRAMGDTESFSIPEGAWVVSGHDAGASFVQTVLQEGSPVSFE